MRSTRSRVIAVTTAAAIGLVGGAASAQTQVAAAAEESGSQRAQSSFSIGGCVIRLYAAGPRIHANGTHTCVGVKSVRVTNMGRLQINYTRPGRTVAVHANADELLVGRGIQAGVDGSRSYATVTLYDSKIKRRLHLKRSGHYARAAGSTSNIWFSSTRIPS